MNLLFSAITGFVLIAVVWRVASRRQSLPCPVWLRWLVELDNPFTKTNRAATIVGQLGLERGMCILDLGCGPGRLTVPLAKQVGDEGRVMAVDIQAGMLARAREKAQAEGLTNIEFVHAAAGDDRLGQDRFDRVLLVTVLGEIPDREAALGEVHRALKPGGILSVTEIVFDPHFQRKSTVLRLAGQAGLRECGFFGNRIAYTLHLEKRAADDTSVGAASPGL